MEKTENHYNCCSDNTNTKCIPLFFAYSGEWVNFHYHHLNKQKFEHHDNLLLGLGFFRGGAIRGFMVCMFSIELALQPLLYVFKDASQTTLIYFAAKTVFIKHYDPLFLKSIIIYVLLVP